MSMTAVMPAENLMRSPRIVEFPFETTHWRSATDHMVPAVAADLLPPPPNAPPPLAPPMPMPSYSLRDFFAAFALAALVLATETEDATARNSPALAEDEIADCAYAYADAMLRRRHAPPDVCH